MNRYRVPVEFETVDDETAQRAVSFLRDTLTSGSPRVVVHINNDAIEFELIPGELTRESVYWQRVEAPKG